MTLMTSTTVRKARAGLLPLYLELYDQRLPEMRRVLDPFLAQVVSGLSAQGIEVIAAPVCRRKSEFAAALGDLSSQGIDAIVTLHLAYSPSLESAELLAASPLPLILCDTTLDHDFGRSTPFDRILYNHGIHGLQDLASMLRRLGKSYRVAAGHVSESNVIGRTANLVRAAYAASRLRHTKALRLGPTFAGMGDFALPDAALRDSLGIGVRELPASALGPFVRSITEKQVREEMEEDRRRYEVTAPAEVHARSVRVGLALRQMLADSAYDAFSLNFLAFDSKDGPVDTVPFLEASKAMSRGVGYAGEGDCLTASLVGALACAFGDTTFTEIFCPDWQGNSVFLSHMGEINPAVAADHAKPLLCEKPFPFTPTNNPAILTCAPRPGEAVLVNLAPQAQGFDLLVSPVEVLGDGSDPSMREQIRGWIRPRRAVADFLETYSMHGGTHHSALVLGEKAEALQAFAAFAGLGCYRI